VIKLIKKKTVQFRVRTYHTSTRGYQLVFQPRLNNFRSQSI